MKKKLKYFVSDFIKNSYFLENAIPIHNLSIYISVIIACLSLRKHKSRNGKMNITYHNYNSEFKDEIQLIKQRFPELIKVFNNTESKLKEKPIIQAERLKFVF